MLVMFFCIAPKAFAQDVTEVISGSGSFSGVLSHDMGALTVERPDSGYRWIDRIANIPDYMRDFHGVFGNLVKDVLDGKQNCLSDPSLGEKIYSVEECIDTYNLKVVSIKDTLSFTFTKGYKQDKIGLVASNAVYDYMVNQTYYISDADQFGDYLLMSLNYDYPEAFWLNSKFRFMYRWPFSYNAVSLAGTGTIYVEFQLYLRLADDYFDNRYYELLEGFQDFKYSTVTEYNDSVNSILENIPSTSKSRCAKIVYFNDWLTKHNGYCSDNPVLAPATIRSSYAAITGSAGKNGPVCEGYARAFKVLCDRSGIPCIVVTGNARQNNMSSPELHMWNEVQLEDSLWYAVDVTWNDPISPDNPKAAVSGYETDFWLLRGKRDMVSQGMTFAESHPNSLTWSSAYKGSWLYYPELGIKSLITNNRFNIEDDPYNEGDAVDDVYYNPTGYLVVYSLDGQRLGTFLTFDGMRRALDNTGIVVVNGKKMLLR